MKRSNRKRNDHYPDAIITADIELRLTPPICRTDEDYFGALSKKIKFIRDLSQEYGGIPILDGGDLFDKKYKQHPSHFLISWAINNLPMPFHTVPGNHDLPGKTMENYKNSAISVLEEAGIISTNPFPSIRNDRKLFIHSIPWGEEIKPLKLEGIDFDYSVVLIHAMVYHKDLPFPGCEGCEKGQILRMFKNFDLIVCGHHHKTFTTQHKKTGTILVNPGSMMRNDADQIDHKPCVFLWYAQENRVEKVYLPIAEDVVSREHLELKENKETRLNAFIEKLGQQSLSGINFEENLEILLMKDVSQGIINKVWEYYET